MVIAVRRAIPIIITLVTTQVVAVTVRRSAALRYLQETIAGLLTDTWRRGLGAVEWTTDTPADLRIWAIIAFADFRHSVWITFIVWIVDTELALRAGDIIGASALLLDARAITARLAVFTVHVLLAASVTIAPRIFTVIGHIHVTGADEATLVDLRAIGSTRLIALITTIRQPITDHLWVDAFAIITGKVIAARVRSTADFITLIVAVIDSITALSLRDALSAVTAKLVGLTLRRWTISLV